MSSDVEFAHRETRMSLPLEGIRVVELSVWMLGPLAGVMLADLGAEVIKVEEPVAGDPGRGAIRFYGIDVNIQRGEQTANLFFELNNCNKKSMTLDLKTVEGREVAYRLVQKSDVFLQNLRPGRIAALGMDYETLKRYNPKLIFASGSGYGGKGPDILQPANDPTGSARASMYYGVDPAGPPRYMPGAMGDCMGAVMLAYGVLAALLSRNRSGQGQALDASQLGSLIWLQYLRVGLSLAARRPIEAHDRTKADNPLNNYYQCADGNWIALGCLQSDKYWHDFCGVMGIEQIENDPKFRNHSARSKNSVELIQTLDPVFKNRPLKEWLQLLRQTRAEIVCTPVNNIMDLASDPQVLAGEYIIDFNHPVLGTLSVPGNPLQYTGIPRVPRTPCAEFGQHTEEILLELGYNWQEIETMRSRRII